MNEMLLAYIVFQVLLLSILIAFVRLYLKADRTLFLEKRLLKFSLHISNEKNTSFFDKLKFSYHIFIESIAKILEKNKLMRNYSKHYEKYVTTTKIIRDTALNIVANKLVFSVFGIIVAISSNILRQTQFSILQLILVVAIGFLIPDVVMFIGKKKEDKRIERDFLKAVIVMNNAFKSGRSIIQAIEVVANELDGPVSLEFKKMHTDLTYGLDLEVVFDRFSKRINLEESKYMAASLVIINKTGGDIVKVFSSIEKSFLARKRLNDELKSSTALSNFVFKILIAVPFIIFLAMFIINPTYFNPFITSFIGKLMLILIVVIYIVYILIIRKIMKVKEW